MITLLQFIFFIVLKSFTYLLGNRRSYNWIGYGIFFGILFISNTLLGTMLKTSGSSLNSFLLFLPAILSSGLYLTFTYKASMPNELLLLLSASLLTIPVMLIIAVSLGVSV